MPKNLLKEAMEKEAALGLVTKGLSLGAKPLKPFKALKSAKPAAVKSVVKTPKPAGKLRKAANTAGWATMAVPGVASGQEYANRVPGQVKLAAKLEDLKDSMNLNQDKWNSKRGQNWTEGRSQGSVTGKVAQPLAGSGIKHPRTAGKFGTGREVPTFISKTASLIDLVKISNLLSFGKSLGTAGNLMPKGKNFANLIPSATKGKNINSIVAPGRAGPFTAGAGMT